MGRRQLAHQSRQQIVKCCSVIIQSVGRIKPDRLREIFQAALRVGRRMALNEVMSFQIGLVCFGSLLLGQRGLHRTLYL